MQIRGNKIVFFYSISSILMTKTFFYYLYVRQILTLHQNFIFGRFIFLKFSKKFAVAETLYIRF